MIREESAKTPWLKFQPILAATPKPTARIKNYGFLPKTKRK